MSNIIDSIQLSGTTYQIQGSGGNNVVELTQAEYDALVDKDPTAFYIITDATAGDLTNYYTKTETDDLLDGKQATLQSGTNIKTINNESILGSGNIDIQGGGKAIEAGRGISVTTGETADTVSFNLAIYDRGNFSLSECHGEVSNAPFCSSNFCHLEQTSGGIGSGSHSSHKEGTLSKIGDNSNNSHVEGYNCEVGTLSPYSHAEGQYTKTSNQSEHASGQYNASSKASYAFGNSGNTLFSVGNGTSTSARHNAFEIRQNGDIYLNDGTNDVKLQDTITATAANTTALGGLSLVKLTQAQYDALSPNYDSNTLYVIVN